MTVPANRAPAGAGAAGPADATVGPILRAGRIDAGEAIGVGAPHGD
jgi:hypothetical protein